MKQILQFLKSGATEVAEVPVPGIRRGQFLIRTSQTLVSFGTERMLVHRQDAKARAAGVTRTGFSVLLPLMA